MSMKMSKIAIFFYIFIGWLSASTNELRPSFDDVKYITPCHDLIMFTIAR